MYGFNIEMVKKDLWYNIDMKTLEKTIYQNKKWLEKKYLDERLHIYEIGKLCGVTNVTINNWMAMFNIPRRSRSECQKGKKISEKTKHKWSIMRRGENNHNWRGGVSTLYHLVRTNFKSRQWRSDIFTRDDFTCQMCSDNRGHNLKAHHKIAFMKILQKYEITTLEEALGCEELWNINNGITLCEDCHRKIHKKVGDKYACNTR